MPVTNDQDLINYQGLFFYSNLNKIKNFSHKKCILFLHGWNGNEGSMDLLFSKMPTNVVFISPRAFYTTMEGGNTWAPSIQSWSNIQHKKRSPLSELTDSAHRLNRLIRSWFVSNNFIPEEISIVGFSQGAAVSLLSGLIFPDFYNKVVCLSGFLPENFSFPLSEYSNRFLMVHGTQDELIPIQSARDTYQKLHLMGTSIKFYVGDFKHKISLSHLDDIIRFLMD